MRVVHVRAGQRVFMVLVNFFCPSTSLAYGGVMCRPGVVDTGGAEDGVSIASHFTRAMLVMSS
jgi:hypothetical protein